MTIYLWDTRGIEASSPFYNEQEKRDISALALSRDCSWVACGFVSGEVELWEASSLNKQPIATHTHHPKEVTTLVYSPDSRQFASGSDDGTINLWDGKDGTLSGTLEYPTKPGWRYKLVAEISNTVLAVAGGNGIILWDLETLDHIHTFDGPFDWHLSFSADGALLAAVHIHVSNRYAHDLDARRQPDGVLRAVRVPALYRNIRPYHIVDQASIFDVTTCAIISTIIDSCAMTFVPDNSQLVIQPFLDDSYDYDHDYSDIRTFNLANGKLERGPTLQHFMQLRNMPLCHGVLVSIMYSDPPYLGAIFSGHDRPVPVLWIPRGLRLKHVMAWGRSAIALVDVNSSIILVRILTSPPGW